MKNSRCLTTFYFTHPHKCRMKLCKITFCAKITLKGKVFPFSSENGQSLRYVPKKSYVCRKLAQLPKRGAEDPADAEYVLYVCGLSKVTTPFFFCCSDHFKMHYYYCLARILNIWLLFR